MNGYTCLTISPWPLYTSESLSDAVSFIFRGSRKIERGFSRPYDELAREGHPRYSRSMSDNWREKGPEEDDDGDWRKAGSRDRWSESLNHF